MKENKIFIRRNEGIRVPKVLVIKDGQKIGELPTPDAIKMARDEGLDLIEVVPHAKPPVCHITDYGKYLFDLKKKLKQQQKVAGPEEKEVNFRYVISDHDLQTKANQVKRIIEHGDKVRIVLEFKARENQHRDVGITVMNKCLDMLKGAVQVDKAPTFEGRFLIAKVSKL
jgi:translation initiation factor IF-3